MMPEVTRQQIVGTPALRLATSIAANALHHCPGCHYGIILRLFNEVLDEMNLRGDAIGVSGGGCGWWVRYLEIDGACGIHGPNSAVASAIKRIRPSNLVFAVQGDGEMAAIGLGSFVSAAVRGEHITCVGTNNACYGMTGGQLAPTTLLGMVTTTTPTGRTPESGHPLHAPELVAPLAGVAYAARGSVHNLANYRKTKNYLKKAFQCQMDNLGFSVVEILSACPPNWKLTPVECLKFIDEKMAAEFPLGEFKNVLRGAK